MIHEAHTMIKKYKVLALLLLAIGQASVASPKMQNEDEKQMIDESEESELDPGKRAHSFAPEASIIFGEQRILLKDEALGAGYISFSRCLPFKEQELRRKAEGLSPPKQDLYWALNGGRKVHTESAIRIKLSTPEPEYFHRRELPSVIVEDVSLGATITFENIAEMSALKEVYIHLPKERIKINTLYGAPELEELFVEGEIFVEETKKTDEKDKKALSYLCIKGPNTQEDIEHALEPLTKLQKLSVYSGTSNYSDEYGQSSRLIGTSRSSCLTRVPLDLGACLAHLKSLDLISNCITSIEPISQLSSELKHLDLRDNLICSMSSLRKANFPHLWTLDVSRNPIVPISGMERMGAEKLYSVTLTSESYIADLIQVAKWQPLPQNKIPNMLALKDEFEQGAEFYAQISKKVVRSGRKIGVDEYGN